MKMNTHTELTQVLITAYGMSDPEIAFIRAGVDGNQTFKVTSNGTPFIARIYGDQGCLNPDHVRYELELLAHLATNGISVAAPVATNDGNWMHLAPRGDGAPPAPIALFTIAEGGVEWPTTADRAHLLGAAFAQLHRAAENFHTTACPRTFDLERLIQKPLQHIRPYLDDSNPADRAAWEILTQTAARASALFAAVPDAGGAIGPIHADLHQGNCHFNLQGNGDQLTFFDFSNAGVGWRVYDLSGFLWPLRDATIQKPAIRLACDSFLAGYRSIRPMLPEEEKAVYASVKTRDIWETGCWLEFGESLEPESVRAGLHAIADRFRRFPLVG